MTCLPFQPPFFKTLNIFFSFFYCLSLFLKFFFSFPQKSAIAPSCPLSPYTYSSPPAPKLNRKKKHKKKEKKMCAYVGRICSFFSISSQEKVRPVHVPYTAILLLFSLVFH